MLIQYTNLHEIVNLYLIRGKLDMIEKFDNLSEPVKNIGLITFISQFIQLSLIHKLKTIQELDFNGKNIKTQLLKVYTDNLEEILERVIKQKIQKIELKEIIFNKIELTSLRTIMMTICRAAWFAEFLF